MKFYHGTNSHALELMKVEGVLWGKPGSTYRYTYLSPDRTIAKRFGAGVLLEVEYEPKGNKGKALKVVHTVAPRAGAWVETRG